MSDTPRTDDAHTKARVGHQAMPDKDWPWKAIGEGWDFARELEQENAELIAALETIVNQRADGAKVSREEWQAATEAARAALAKAKKQTR